MDKDTEISNRKGRREGGKERKKGGKEGNNKTTSIAEKKQNRIKDRVK